MLTVLERPAYSPVIRMLRGELDVFSNAVTDVASSLNPVALPEKFVADVTSASSLTVSVDVAMFYEVTKRV